MKEQFLNLSGLIDLVTYIKLCIAQHKVIIPRASFSLFPETGEENNIYIDTSTNAIYRWNGTDKNFVLLAKPPRTIAISEGTNNGEITLKVDNIASNAKVHGLTSTAFTESNKFATAAQGAKADSAVQTITLSSGTKNGTIKIKVNNITTDNIEVAGLGSAAFSDIGIFAAKSHTHKKDEVGLGNVDNTADINKSVKYATSAGSIDWSGIKNKPSVYPPPQDFYDDRFYTKSQVDSKLSSKSDTGHTHVQFIQETKFSNGTYTDPLNGTTMAIKASGGIAADLIYEGGTTLSSKYQAKGSYASNTHTHDDRYYTETEMNSKLAGKAEKSHTHSKSEVGLGNVDNIADKDKSVNYATSANLATYATKLQTYKAGSTTETYDKQYLLYAQWVGNDLWLKIDNYKVKTDFAISSDSASSVPWSGVQDKPSTFTPSSHSHTKSQIVDFPAAIKNPNSIKIQLNSGTTEGTNQFTYDGSAAKTINITPSSIGAAASSHTHSSVTDIGNGSPTTFAYSKSGLGYGDFEWLAAWNGCELRAVNKSLFAQASHTHTKSQITDFPSSLPASDVYAWAKASTKPSYSYTEITNRPTLIKAVSKNGYWGMADHDGSDSNWIRTTTAGIIPYQSGGAGAGHCGIGTSSWYFSNAYIDTVNCVNTNASGYLQANGLINTYSEYQSQKGKRDWRFGSATGAGDQDWFGFYDYTSGYHGGIYGPSHLLRMNGEIQSTAANAFRAIQGNYGFIMRNDGSYFYFMPTNSGDVWGSWAGWYSSIHLPSGQWTLRDNKNHFEYPVLTSTNDTYRVVRTQKSGNNFRFDDAGGTARYCTGSASDIRLKKNISKTEITNALSIINSIKLRSFDWKETNEHQKIGFVADELEEIDSKFAYGGGETEEGNINVKVVDTFYLQGYIVKALQELSSQVSVLKQENKQLKQKLNMCN